MKRRESIETQKKSARCGRGNVVDLRHGMMFDFYLGLPHFHKYTILLLEEMTVQFTIVILEAHKLLPIACLQLFDSTWHRL